MKFFCCITKNGGNDIPAVFRIPDQLTFSQDRQLRKPNHMQKVQDQQHRMRKVQDQQHHKKKPLLRKPQRSSMFHS
jgi:hypothetical protein